MHIFKEYISKIDNDELRAVFEKNQDLILFMIEAFTGIERRDMSPYAIHPMEVAKIVYEETQSESLFRVAIMHDILEDTDYKSDDLLKYLSPYEIEVVETLSKTSTVDRELYYEKIKNDWGASAVKVADRIHNLRSSWLLGHEKDARKFRSWYHRTTHRDMSEIKTDPVLDKKLQIELRKIKEEMSREYIK